MSYFVSFPSITYANVVVADITRRVGVPQSVLRQPTAFSPYTVEAGQRQDLVSYLYYGQDDDDWMISLANQIVDPYYGWYMTDDELVRFVIRKFGSLPDAMGRIDHWVSNWSEDHRQITPSYYRALTENLQKYWIPVYGAGTDILSYARRPEDWRVATNRIQTLVLGAAAPFQALELVTVYDPPGAQAGTGEVVWVSGETVTIKDVRGTWANGYTMTTSSGSGTITSIGEPRLLIPIDEEVYFTSVSGYDVEYDLNEENKEVLLIQDNYRGIMYTELVAELAK